MYDDYDEDGNNIVRCPICLSNHCPSKEDGKCPDEDEFVRAMTYKDIAEGFRKSNVYPHSGKTFHPTKEDDFYARQLLTYFQTAYTPLIEEARRDGIEKAIRLMQHQARNNFKTARAAAEWGDVYLKETNPKSQ